VSLKTCAFLRKSFYDTLCRVQKTAVCSAVFCSGVWPVVGSQAPLVTQVLLQHLPQISKQQCVQLFAARGAWQAI